MTRDMDPDMTNKKEQLKKLLCTFKENHAEADEFDRCNLWKKNRWPC